MMRANLADMMQAAVCGSGPHVEICIAVDDTDDMTRKTSTGEIAEAIAQGVLGLGGQLLLQITRHQLLVRDDIPYTSHNSAMAFKAILPEEKLPFLYDMAAEAIRIMRAATSDPGLCIAVPPYDGTVPASRRPGCPKLRSSLRRYGPDVKPHRSVSALQDRGPLTPMQATGADSGSGSGPSEALRQSLLDFGQRAKVEFCPVDEAYRLAESIPWVSLTSHGGDESGVVGALAGVGLRLGGDDGRFRGRWDLAKLCKDMVEPRAGMVAASLSRRFNGPVLMVDVDGGELPASTRFALDGEVKPILFNDSLTVVCEVRDGEAHPCRKIDLGMIGNKANDWSRVCEVFEWDNDGEEQFDGTPSCANCLYRRWTARGFTCTKDTEWRPSAMT